MVNKYSLYFVFTHVQTSHTYCNYRYAASYRCYFNGHLVTFYYSAFIERKK